MGASEIRSEFKFKREQELSGLSLEQRDALAAQAAGRVLAMVERLSKPMIGLFRSTPGELPTDPLILTLQGSWFSRFLTRRRFAFPRVLGSDGQMEFRNVPDLLTTTWVRGRYGIDEPHEAYPLVTPEQFTVIVVPGVAFSEQGGRIGMGKGFYDRFLKLAPQAAKVGWALDCQVVPKFPDDALKSWDVGMDFIVTPTRTIRCEAKA